MARKPASAPAPAPVPAATQAPSPGAAAAADQVVEHSIEDLGIVYTFPMGLTKGTVTLPDGRVIVRTRVNALQVNEAIMAAWQDPAAPEQEHP